MNKSSVTVTVLGSGTSAGVPMIACQCAVCTSTHPKDKRLRSSIAIQSATTSIVIDSGPDFRQQMLTHNINRLDAIVFTHSHKDHIAGLDDVRAYNFFYEKPMHLYVTEFTEKRLRNEFDYAFAEVKYEGVPQLIINRIDLSRFTIGDIELQPIAAWHHKMPVLGFRIGNFAYLTDANRIEDEELKKLEGIDTLVVNALRKQTHLSHFTLQEAIDLSQQLNVKNAYFTHISHQMGLHNDVDQELPQNMQLAYDGLTISINSN